MLDITPPRVVTRILETLIARTTACVPPHYVSFPSLAGLGDRPDVV